MPTTGRLGDSGITLADGTIADDYGVRWKWNPSNATGNKPAPVEQVGDRANADGQWDGTRYYGPRNRDITGSARAKSHEALHAAEQRLRDAVSLAGFDLIITEPGFTGRQRVRQSGELQWTETTNTDGYAHATFSFGLYAPDPLIYALAETVAGPIGFPSTSGGPAFPITFPFSFNAAVTSGRLSLTNTGALDLPLRLHLTGPVTAATVANPDTGEALRMVRPDAMPLLASGEYLDIDTGTHRVTLLGTASRRSWVWGDFLMLPARKTTTFALSGTASPDARLTIAVTPARL